MKTLYIVSYIALSLMTANTLKAAATAGSGGDLSATAAGGSGASAGAGIMEGVGAGTTVATAESIGSTAAGVRVPLYEEDLTTLRYTDPSGRTFRAERFDYENPMHVAAAMVIDEDTATESFWSTDLLRGTPDRYSGTTATLIRELHTTIKGLRSYFPDEYLMFLEDNKTGESKVIGSFGLGLPDSFVDIMNFRALSARVAQESKPVEVPSAPPLHEDTKVYLEKHEPASILLSEEEAERGLAGYCSMSSNVLKAYQKCGIGKVMLDLIRHQILDHVLGKSIRMPVYNPATETFSLTWSPPICGYKADIFPANIVSLASQVSGDKVGVVNAKIDGCFTVVYPPNPALCNPPVRLELAKTLVAMEKAHHAAAGDTAAGAGGAASAGTGAVRA